MKEWMKKMNERERERDLKLNIYKSAKCHKTKWSWIIWN